MLFRRVQARHFQQPAAKVRGNCLRIAQLAGCVSAGVGAGFHDCTNAPHLPQIFMPLQYANKCGRLHDGQISPHGHSLPCNSPDFSAASCCSSVAFMPSNFDRAPCVRAGFRSLVMCAYVRASKRRDQVAPMCLRRHQASPQGIPSTAAATPPPRRL